MTASQIAGTFVLIAGLAAAARAQSPASVTYFPSDAVDASFAKSPPPVLFRTGNVRIMTSTRMQGGEAEVHAADGDLFYVVEGNATFLVGGTLVEAREIEPGETRAKGLDGGTPYELKAGDIISIPAGVPHWFKSMPGKFRYLVLKIGATK